MQVDGGVDRIRENETGCKIRLGSEEREERDRKTTVEVCVKCKREEREG